MNSTAELVSIEPFAGVVFSSLVWLASWPVANWPVAQWPVLIGDTMRVLTLQDYNTRLVVLGTGVLGAAAGLIGGFTLLRRRALMGDAISHAALPGIAIAYLIYHGLVGDSVSDSKPHGWLLLGATISGLLGVVSVVAIGRYTRLKEDTALGIVLSVFFGAGVALMGIIQQLRGGSAAGLEGFIYGKTASMTAVDVQWIVAAAVIASLAGLLLHKEWMLLCFDEGFAGSRGYPTTVLDLSLMAAVIAISIVGLQAVGLILMIALLVIPPSAARFWTDTLSRMLWISVVVGALSGLCGSLASALFPDLPSGAMIVLTCASFFGISLFVGPVRGVFPRMFRRRRLNRIVAHQHLLRAMYEAQEQRSEDVVTVAELTLARSWSSRQLERVIERGIDEEWILKVGDDLQLTRRGFTEARRLTREHRLWELYLMTHADVAPARVDRQADRIEHVLEPEIIAELRQMLGENDLPMPASPHQVGLGDGSNHDIRSPT